MPKFPIIRCDRDLSLNKLAPTYFASRGILLRARRSVHHMGFLEGIIRNIKRKFIQNLRKNEPRSGWTEKKLERALSDVTYSYNNTVSSSHGRTPASVNSSLFDPFLREALYGHQAKLQPFEVFYKEQLKLRKKPTHLINQVKNLILMREKMTSRKDHLFTLITLMIIKLVENTTLNVDQFMK